MEWWVFMLLFLAALFFLLMLRVPVAIGLLAVGMAAAVWQFGGFDRGMDQVARSAYSSVSSFTLAPIPLFILMGEVLFQGGVAKDAINVLNRQLGRVPGRLAVLSTLGGGLFGLLSGSTLANTALFGSTLLPEMTERGYSRKLGMGSILASGGLAMIIPPSALAVLWGAIAQVPIGPLLIAGIVPGALMTLGYLTIVIVYAKRGLAPDTSDEETQHVTVRQRLSDVFRYVLPLGTIIIAVLGLIFLGWATPTESAATGALMAMILVAFYGRLSWQVVLETFRRTIGTTTMIFFILVGSTLYSQVMSFSGATGGFVEAMTSESLNWLVTLLLMQLVLLVLGLFLDQASIMLVTLPLFMPVVQAQGWDPIWFGIIMLINLQIAGTTPPFGLNLFVMKGVVGDKVEMREIYASAIPYLGSDVAVMALLIAVPSIVTFLPNMTLG
jgi:tripartite ATP-independent transporter DctM subunit